ncbi:DMT family transporter [Streptomyces palmae]|uniref:DMT family transporter n=1 Tax=Streptomyces palmae TaxID=1701085 RepID=A0A4Z0HEZ7_9ACTN|nr:DMT family transporter [Streptomyces palmae]TGB18422.1 hypothetical protein E4099_01960 [Streptomyces palmae]
MTALGLSVLLQLISAVCYAGGAILQERVAATAEDAPYAPLRRGSWWAAISLNGAGAALHVLALAYGPLSVVQPLGALTIVFALPMAALFVGRRVGAAGWRGATLATVGLAGLLSMTGPAPAEALARAERVGLTLVTAGLLGVLVLAARWGRRATLRSVLLAVAAGTAFGVSSVFTKNVTVAWTWDSWADGVPSLVMIVLLAAGGVFLSQASYRGAGLAAPLATATVVNPVVASAVGMVTLGEHFRHGLPGGLLALLAGAVAASGLALLASHSAGEKAAGGDADSSEDLGAPRSDAGHSGLNPASEAAPAVPPSRHPDTEGRPPGDSPGTPPLWQIRQIERTTAGPADTAITIVAFGAGPTGRRPAGPLLGELPSAVPRTAFGLVGRPRGGRRAGDGAGPSGRGATGRAGDLLQPHG